MNSYHLNEKEKSLYTSTPAEKQAEDFIYKTGSLFINIFCFFNHNLRRKFRDNLKKSILVSQLNKLEKLINKQYKGYYVLVPYTPWGDFFTGCSLLCNLKKNIDDKILVLCDNQNRMAFAKTFKSIDAVELIDTDKYMYLGSSLFKNKKLNKNSFFSISHWQNPEFKNILPTGLFNFYANLLNLKEPYERENPEYSEKDKEIALKYFNEMGLKKDKTIFISPKAISFDYTVLPVTFWKRLADEFINMGYDVVFNSDNNEYPEYKQIFLPVTQQVEFVRLCSGTIAFRSGLVDVLAGSGINNITTIYPAKMNFLTLSREEMEKEFRKDFYFEQDLSFEENLLKLFSINNTTDNKHKELIFNNDTEKLLKDLTEIYTGAEQCT